MSIPLGYPLPPDDNHAVSVSMPTWRDTEGWAQRDPAVLSKLQTGYPRFYVPHLVRELAKCLLDWMDIKRSTKPDEASADLFPSRDMALACRWYLQKDLTLSEGGQEVQSSKAVEALEIAWDGTIRLLAVDDNSPGRLTDDNITFFNVHAQGPSELPRSAALATYMSSSTRTPWPHKRNRSGNTPVSVSRVGSQVSGSSVPPFFPNIPDEAKMQEPGRFLPDAGSENRKKITTAIAESYGHGVDDLDVRLFHTGMSAITHTAIALKKAMNYREEEFCVCVFGFLYVDTFKVLSKVLGFKFVLYGHATPEEMDKLEADLASDRIRISALFTEFPGNPLLGCLDIARLCVLSHKYNFVLVVDDTVGTSVNVDLLPYCDIICTSLTKMFSGGCNVMGGSVVLKPRARYTVLFHQAFRDIYQDVYFVLDSATMLNNSLRFKERVQEASISAEIIAKILRKSSVVKRVYYPKGSRTQDLYEMVAKPYTGTGMTLDRKGKRFGYGFLLSIAFKTPEAAIAFHDALEVAKGPSLGTNFTLMCAYTLLAHYSELNEVAEYGLPEHLVRISVGLENIHTLVAKIKKALEVAKGKRKCTVS
ncbi:PLP-dependent transferase [Apiospora arundinis]